MQDFGRAVRAHLHAFFEVKLQNAEHSVVTETFTGLVANDVFDLRRKPDLAGRCRGGGGLWLGLGFHAEADWADDRTDLTDTPGLAAALALRLEIFGRAAMPSWMIFRMRWRSGPLSVMRGARTHSEPRPVSCTANFIYCTNFVLVSRW